MSRSSNRDSSPELDQRIDHVSYLSDWRMADSIGTAVVLSVADYTNHHPTDLPVLSTAVDPDALDQLLDSSNNEVAISFSYAGCEVILKSDGELAIT